MIAIYTLNRKLETIYVESYRTNPTVIEGSDWYWRLDLTMATYIYRNINKAKSLNQLTPELAAAYESVRLTFREVLGDEMRQNPRAIAAPRTGENRADTAGIFHLPRPGSVWVHRCGPDLPPPWPNFFSLT